MRRTNPSCLQKLDIHDFLKELGVPWTVIDVGAWMQFCLPLPSRSTVPAFLKPMGYTISGDGEAKQQRGGATSPPLSSLLFQFVLLSSLTQ